MTNWKIKDEEFKQILHRTNDPNNEMKSVTNTKKELIPHLKSCSCWANLPKSTLAAMEKATTFHTLNQAISELYDYADENCIWLGFMPMD